MGKQAGRARKPTKSELARIDHDFRTKEPAKPPDASELPVEISRDEVKLHCAKLYGRGFGRATIARALVSYIVPKTTARTEEQRYHAARTQLRRWEQQPEFRDMVYQHAVVELDMQTPSILRGVAGRAKHGRVDAARLALELTGRHNPKGAEVETNVVIKFDGIPRP